MFGCSLYVLMMFGCPLYIHNTKKACFVRLRGCPYAPIHLDAPICLDDPCMFGCLPVCLDGPICLNTHTYVWMLPVYLDICHMFGFPLVCLDDVWMPPVYIQHKESMLCQTKGVSLCPLYFWMPSYVWMHPLYVWIPYMFGWLPVCLDALHMFGYPLYVLMPTYVWTPPMFGCLLYVWMPPVCLDALTCLDAPTVYLDAPICLDTFLYVWMPPMFGHPPVCLDIYMDTDWH